MRVGQHFSSNKSVGELLLKFLPSQGSLFHYTDQAASIGIRRGEVRMTRADCFLDQSEIAYGLAILSEAARTTLGAEEIESFNHVLGALRVRLQRCFVLSLSQDSDSDYLKSKYAGNGGAILEFQENFPVMFHGASWHSIPNGEGSGTVHLIADLYEFFEGFVVYDRARQLQLAEIACQTYRNIQSTDTHFVDKYHFIDILIQCCVLFKRPEFEIEKEYRIALIRNQKDMQSFEETINHEGKNRTLIKVMIPSSSDAVRIRARNAQD